MRGLIFMLFLSLAQAAAFAGPPTATPPAAPPAGQRVNITIFLPALDGRLGTMPTSIGRDAILEKMVKSTMDILSTESGKAGGMLKTAKVETVFLDSQKTVYLDFNEDVSSKQPGGITLEVASVAAICKTVLTNFDVDAVKILQKGKEMKTLAGHVDVESKLTRSKCDNLANYR